MRHGKKFNHLGRKSAHRKSMLSNMACSLIKHKSIKTTLAKAKALRLFIEPILTKSKNDTTHSRRVVFSYLKQKEAITELFGEIAVKIKDRPGGYLRILKIGNRLGDNAQMAYVELVDYNEEYVNDKPNRKKSRRKRKKSTGDSVTAKEVSTNNKDFEKETAVAVETPATEETPVAEETPATEETPANEETPATEETPANEETPVAEETPATEETPANEETPVAEETPSDENKKEKE